MSSEFIILSILQGFLVVFIIFGLIFEKNLIRLEKDIYIRIKAGVKRILSVFADLADSTHYGKRLHSSARLYKH